MSTLPYPELFFLNAAKGWCLLGDLAEAQGELKQLSPRHLEHPDVLEVRFSIAAKRKDWIECMEISACLLETVPERATAWINCAYTLHGMNQTQEAWDALFTVRDRFPGVPIIPYNLACYACRLGKLDDSRQWLRWALQIGGKALRQQAVADADLQPLWTEIKLLA
jgi:predicted Zn-dependent protease